MLNSYSKAQELLTSKLEIPSVETTVYLLGKDMYAEVFKGSHPEWTQGFAQGAEIYINRAPVRVWDASVKAEDRIRWLLDHGQEVIERTTAHELTHAALHKRQLPRWMDEGMAEHIESLIAPPESAARQLLQRRYTVRDAMSRGVAPPAAQLAAPDWMESAGSEEEFGLLYALSSLIVKRVADTSGDEGLRRLIDAKALDMPLDDFIGNELQQWLLTRLPEEVAAAVLCGLNRAIGMNIQITADWNANSDKTQADLTDFKARLQQLLHTINSLAADTIVEDVRLAYAMSASEWIAAIDAYLAGDYDQGNSHLSRSNSVYDEGYQLFSSAWEEYVVVRCALVEEQLH